MNREIYRLAGELFGLLQEGLGSGELQMRGFSQGIKYVWYVKAGKQTWYYYHNIRFDEILDIPTSIKAYAASTANTMKESARKQIGRNNAKH